MLQGDRPVKPWWLLAVLPGLFLLTGSNAGERFKRLAARDAIVVEALAEGGVIIPAEIVTTAMKFAAEYSRYDKPKRHRQPIGLLMPDSWFLDAVCPTTRTCRAVGMWSWLRPDVVYINSRLAFEQLPSYLVHELVHYLQGEYGWAGGQSCPDISAHEAEAYAVQHLYLVLHEHVNHGFFIPDYTCKADLRL